MREKIIAAVITAVIHNKKTTIAGLVTVGGAALARLGFNVSPDVLLIVAGAVVTVVCAAAGDNHTKVSQ